MALSKRKKLNMKRRWLVIGGDASLNYGKVLSTHKTEAEAREAKPLFGIVRAETPEEVEFRLRKPDLPSPCYFMLDFSDYSRVARELWRLDGMGAETTVWSVGSKTALYYGHNTVGARRFQSAAFGLQVDCQAYSVDPSKELQAAVPFAR